MISSNLPTFAPRLIAIPRDMRIARAEAPLPTCWWRARQWPRRPPADLAPAASRRGAPAAGFWRGTPGKISSESQKKGGSLARVAVAGSDSPWSPGSLHHTRPERYGVLLSLNENCRGERSLLVVYLLLWALRRVVADLTIYTNHARHVSWVNGLYKRVGREAHVWNHPG